MFAHHRQTTLCESPDKKLPVRRAGTHYTPA